MADRNGHTATGGFAVLSAAGLIVKMLSILYVPVLLAILGEEGSGVYAASYQVYVFVYILTNSGIPIAISKLVSELSALNNHRDALRSFRIARSLLIVAGIATALLMLFTAKPLSAALNFNKARMAILALSPSLLFTSIASAYRGYFQGRGNMVPTALSQVLEQVVHMVFTVIFAASFLQYGLEAACAGGAAGTSIGALFSAGFLIIYFNKYSKKISGSPLIAPLKQNGDIAEAPVKRHSYRHLAGRLVQYGIPITLCIGLQYAGNLVDLWNTKARLLVAGFSDEGASILYNYLYKYQQLMNAPISVVSALSAVVLPAVAAAAVLKNREMMESRIRYAFRLCMMVVLPSAAGLALLANPVFEVLRFGEGSYIMAYGSTVLVLLSLVQIQTVILQAAGKLYMATVNLVSGITLKIIINYFLISIPGINITGAIIGSLAGYLLPVILNMFLIRKKLMIRSSVADSAFKPLVSSAFMALCVTLVFAVMMKVSNLLSDGYSGYIRMVVITVISVFAGVAAYIYSMALIGGITKDDILQLPERARRLIPRHINALIKQGPASVDD